MITRKRTSNDPHNTFHRKLKIEENEPHSKQGMNSVVDAKGTEAN